MLVNVLTSSFKTSGPNDEIVNPIPDKDLLVWFDGILFSWLTEVLMRSFIVLECLSGNGQGTKSYNFVNHLLPVSSLGKK